MHLAERLPAAVVATGVSAIVAGDRRSRGVPCKRRAPGDAGSRSALARSITANRPEGAVTHDGCPGPDGARCDEIAWQRSSRERLLTARPPLSDAVQTTLAEQRGEPRMAVGSHSLCGSLDPGQDGLPKGGVQLASDQAQSPAKRRATSCGGVKVTDKAVNRAVIASNSTRSGQHHRPGERIGSPRMGGRRSFAQPTTCYDARMRPVEASYENGF